MSYSQFRKIEREKINQKKAKNPKTVAQNGLDQSLTDLASSKRTATSKAVNLQKAQKMTESVCTPGRGEKAKLN